MVKGGARRAAALMAAAMIAGLVPSGAAHAAATGNAVPVVTNDAVTSYGGSTVEVDPLANDRDDRADLELCSWSAPKGVYVEQDDESLEITPNSAKPGTYTLHYKACDYSYLVPGVIVVTVTDPSPVVITKGTDVGQITVENPNDGWVDFIWAPSLNASDAQVGYRQIGPHESGTFRTGLATFVWEAAIESPEDEWPYDGGTYDWATGVSTPFPPDAAAARGAQFQHKRAGHRIHSAPVHALPRSAAAGSSTARSSARAAGVDPTSVRPPVAKHDTVTYWAGALSIAVPSLLHNDRDPQGQRLHVCRLGYDAYFTSKALAFVQNQDLSLYVGRSAGRVTFTYYACNSARMTPSTVTVKIRKAAPVTVASVPGKPRELRVTNPNPAAIHFYSEQSETGRPDSGGLVRAHHSRIFTMRAAKLTWKALIGGLDSDAGTGRVSLPKA